MARQRDNVPEGLRRRLDEAHRGILRVHKALLDHERGRYELAVGAVGGPGEFLQLLINDPWFAWLRPLSSLAALMDEFTASRDPVDPAEGEALLAQAGAMLTPDANGGAFQREYQRALAESPAVVAAHGEWKAAWGRIQVDAG